MVEAHLHFHPGDRNSKPVASFNTKTSNILLRITVPKRTGRKRKRGSEDPWQQAPRAPTPGQSLLSDPEDARRLVGCMQDHPDTYRVEPVGAIGQTHRFRRKNEMFNARASLTVQDCLTLSGLRREALSCQR